MLCAKQRYGAIREGKPYGTSKLQVRALNQYSLIDGDWPVRTSHQIPVDSLDRAVDLALLPALKEGGFDFKKVLEFA